MRGVMAATGDDSATRQVTGGPDEFVGYIDSARDRLWLKVPWFSAEQSAPRSIFDSLLRAVERQVDVRVLLRPEGSNTATIQRLAAGAIPTRMVRYLHEKELLVDERVVAFSSNFTQPELTRNSNVSYSIPSLADRQAAEDAFLAVWDLDVGSTVAGEAKEIDAGQVVPSDLLRPLGRLRLNPLQAMALPAVFGSDRSLLVTAPTGSGKTVVGEAALLKATLHEHGKGVYLTPARALTKEIGAKLGAVEGVGTQGGHADRRC